MYHSSLPTFSLSFPVLTPLIFAFCAAALCMSAVQKWLRDQTETNFASGPLGNLQQKHDCQEFYYQFPQQIGQDAHCFHIWVVQPLECWPSHPVTSWTASRLPFINSQCNTMENFKSPLQLCGLVVGLFGMFTELLCAHAPRHAPIRLAHALRGNIEASGERTTTAGLSFIRVVSSNVSVA